MIVIVRMTLIKKINDTDNNNDENNEHHGLTKLYNILVRDSSKYITTNMHAR